MRSYDPSDPRDLRDVKVPGLPVVNRELRDINIPGVPMDTRDTRDQRGLRSHVPSDSRDPGDV